MAYSASSAGITAMRQWTQDRLLEPTWAFTTLTESETIAKYIGFFCDDGALRTAYAYFNDSNERAEFFFYQFYLMFHNETTHKWRCTNASACAVWLARNFAH